MRKCFVFLSLLVLAFGLVPLVGFAARQPEGVELDSTGLSQISWMFETSQDDWVNTKSMGASGHEGDDYYADDWALAAQEEQTGEQRTFGQIVYAGISGVAIVRPDHGDFGNDVIIYDSESKFALRNAHLSEILVDDGEAVSAGSPIGKVGRSGNSTGSHLHIVLYKGVQDVNEKPITWITFNRGDPPKTIGSATDFAAPFLYNPRVIPEEISATEAKIHVEGADIVWETGLVLFGDLAAAVQTVLPRIVIEYADCISIQGLVGSLELDGTAKPIPSRIIVEYANACFLQGLQQPDGLGNIAKAVPPRIIVEYANISFDRKLLRFSADVTTPPVGPSTTALFTLSLDDGLNMVSLPLRTEVSLTARSFAQQLGATMIIRYDTQQDEFVPFVPDAFTGDGFAIDGGEGYIVNMLSSREVTFTGTAWSNAPAKSAPSKPTREPHWAFAVCGAIYDEDMLLQSSDISISVENHRTGNTAETWVGRLENGRYAIAFVDQNRKDVVNQGDVLGVRLRDTRTGAISKLITHTVTPVDIMRSYVELPMRLDYFTPEENALLQNYPNPFNPDTWIPYQLSEDSHLVIRIHAATGQLIRTLDLGYKSAGFYANRERAAHWDGRNEVGEQVASGVYFYSIKAGSFTGTGKMTVAR